VGGRERITEETEGQNEEEVVLAKLGFLASLQPTTQNRTSFGNGFLFRMMEELPLRGAFFTPPFEGGGGTASGDSCNGMACI